MSFDNGAAVSKPLRVSNAVSPPGNAAGNDDFSSVALDESYLYAAWGDKRISPTNPAAGRQGSRDGPLTRDMRGSGGTP